MNESTQLNFLVGNSTWSHDVGVPMDFNGFLVGVTIRNRLSFLPNTMHALSGSTHSVHPIPTPSSFRSLAPAATMLLSLKSCHWPPSYRVVTSHQDLGQRTILQGGPGTSADVLEKCKSFTLNKYIPLPLLRAGKQEVSST